MAGRSFLSKPNYSFFSADIDSAQNSILPDPPSNSLEFDESDFWNLSPPLDPRKSRPSSRVLKIPARRPACSNDRPPSIVSSLPVNIPDWSKILRGDYRVQRRMTTEDDSGDEEWIPPHEYLARNRMASLSVHEGVGRTLKGRDLSRVRNAIWEKTGFQD